MLSLAMLVAFAYLPNAAGGEIVLTTTQVEACEGYTGFAYSTAPDKETVPGCWTSDERMVHILWADGSIRSYRISDFTKSQGV
jgi:hypothetical protein